MNYTKRWRKVQTLDESWHYEVFDPEYVGNRHEYDIDGWRPLACVWQWQFPSKVQKPWRSQIFGSDPKSDIKTNRDYTTRDSAFRWTEKRVDK